MPTVTFNVLYVFLCPRSNGAVCCRRRDGAPVRRVGAHQIVDAIGAESCDLPASFATTGHCRHRGTQYPALHSKPKEQSPLS